MSSSAARSLSRAGRLYIYAVAAFGVPLGAYCGFSLFRDGLPPKEFLVLAVLTLVSSRFSIKIPSVSSRISPSEMFTFTNVLLFGPEAGAITLAIDSVLLSWRYRMSPAQTLFNFGNLTLSVWISGKLFFLAAGVPPLLTEMAPSSGLMLPLALLTASYFLVNSGLTATAIAFATKRPAWIVWRENFMWLSPGYAGPPSSRCKAADTPGCMLLPQRCASHAIVTGTA